MAKTGAFDFSFMRDQQAYLDFAFLANAEVARVAKQIFGANLHCSAAPGTCSSAPCRFLLPAIGFSLDACQFNRPEERTNPRTSS